MNRTTQLYNGMYKSLFKMGKPKHLTLYSTPTTAVISTHMTGATNHWGKLRSNGDMDQTQAS